MYDRKGNIVDRSELLKIKFLSLTEEIRIIRRQENKIKHRYRRIRRIARRFGWPDVEARLLYREYDSLWIQMHEHRLDLIIRRDNTLAAYRIMRSRITAESVKESCSADDWKDIEHMLKKYGPSEPVQLSAVA